jgi:two-component system sensor histidine kinase BarA
LNLKKKWDLRLRLWPWLLLPLLTALCLALLCRSMQLVPPSSIETLALFFGITLLSVAVAGIGIVAQTIAPLRREQQHLQSLNQELHAALTESRKAAEAQSELFSNLSHELRTPLTAILGYTDLLRRSGLNREQELHLATVGKSARSMLGMINDLLDWSRIEAGRLRLNEDALDIIEAAEDVTALLAPLAYDKDLELVRIVYHDVPPLLRGDPQRLRQILTNLLSNAIKFTTRGEVVLRVLREREDADWVWLRFSVSDSGAGISPEQQQRLFQAYHQASGTVGGSGLGLSITRKLAELMGGSVQMQSAVGAGSTFSAVLPFRLPDVAPAPPAPDLYLRERLAWLLEPHATARLALSNWLELLGMRVRSFESVKELSTALAGSAPDVIIVGLREKDASQPDYLALFQRCTWRNPPLLALIASASIDMHARVREAGAASCLPKSVGQLGLLRELVGLTSLKPAQQQPLAGRRVLIADNNATNRRYIATLCRELALQVEEAADGREALRHWRLAPADYVLLDARMPELDGLNCTRAIRAEATPGSHRSRVITISAHLEPEERKAHLAAGADGVLLKPFDGRELLRALAPQLTAPPPPVSAMLTADPEMLTLLREELPLQIGELEEALLKSDLSAARDAAHQLRGTAAFYHLANLKQVTSAFDLHLLQLHSLTGDQVWPGMFSEVRQALDQAMSQLNSRATFTH